MNCRTTPSKNQFSGKVVRKGEWQKMDTGVLTNNIPVDADLLELCRAVAYGAQPRRLALVHRQVRPEITALATMESGVLVWPLVKP